MNTVKPTTNVVNTIRVLIGGSTLSPTVKGLATMMITSLPPGKVEEVIRVLQDIVRILARDKEGAELLKRIGINPDDIQTRA